MASIIDDYPGARAAREHMVFDDPHLNAADSQLVTPTVGGKTGAVAVHFGTAAWALPRGVRISPIRGGLFVLSTGGRVHCLVVRRGEVRELTLPLGIAARVRREAFGLNS